MWLWPFFWCYLASPSTNRYVMENLAGLHMQSFPTGYYNYLRPKCVFHGLRNSNWLWSNSLRMLRGSGTYVGLGSSPVLLSFSLSSGDQATLCKNGNSCMQPSGSGLVLSSGSFYFNAYMEYHSRKRRQTTKTKSGTGSLQVTTVKIGRHRIPAVTIENGTLACWVHSLTSVTLTRTTHGSGTNAYIDNRFLLDEDEHLRCNAHPGFALARSKVSEQLTLVLLGITNSSEYKQRYDFAFPKIVQEIKGRLRGCCT